MLARENLVTRLNNESVLLVVEPAASMIGIGGGFLQSRICGNHLARHQILPYAEMFERPLRLCPPELGARHVHFTEAVGLFSNAHYRRVATGCSRCAHGLLLLETSLHNNQPDTYPLGEHIQSCRRSVYACQYSMRAPAHRVRYRLRISSIGVVSTRPR